MLRLQKCTHQSNNLKTLKITNVSISNEIVRFSCFEMWARGLVRKWCVLIWQYKTQGKPPLTQLCGMPQTQQNKCTSWCALFPKTYRKINVKSQFPKTTKPTTYRILKSVLLTWPQTLTNVTWKAYGKTLEPHVCHPGAICGSGRVLCKASCVHFPTITHHPSAWPGGMREAA